MAAALEERVKRLEAERDMWKERAEKWEQEAKRVRAASELAFEVMEFKEQFSKDLAKLQG